MTTKKKYTKMIANAYNMAYEMNDLKVRFYNFIHENNVAGFTPVKLRFGQETEPVESYKFSLEESNENEAIFRSVIIDYDVCEEVYFHMPVEYMENPSEWESYVSEELQADRLLAREILTEVFGPSSSLLFPYLTSTRPEPETFSTEEFNRYLAIEINRAIACRVIPQNLTEEAFFRPLRSWFHLIYDRETGNIYDHGDYGYLCRPTIKPFYTR